MPNLSPIDAQLVEAVSAPTPVSIADVVGVMAKIDSILPSSDGLKWFNKLYMMVTEEIDTKPPGGGWANAAWLTRLDVVFAGYYFAAISESGNQSAKMPRSWSALFAARNTLGIDRIQFALAGMNAHINHDLALALLDTDDQMNLTPGLTSPEHGDYERVNAVLEAVLPAALRFLATDILGELAQDTGKIGRLLAIWDVRAARELAWDFADHLRTLTGVGREVALDAQDQLTGVIGRSLLLPT